MGTRQRLGRTITGLLERRKNEKSPARIRCAGQTERARAGGRIKRALTAQSRRSRASPATLGIYSRDNAVSYAASPVLNAKRAARKPPELRNLQGIRFTLRLATQEAPLGSPPRLFRRADLLWRPASLRRRELSKRPITD
jgi:hypothetical protein